MAALTIKRQSLPSLRLVAHELAAELTERFPRHALTEDYSARLASL
jgi:hypothetical protein